MIPLYHLSNRPTNLGILPSPRFRFFTTNRICEKCILKGCAVIYIGFQALEFI